jgi:hypothetical protein
MLAASSQTRPLPLQLELPLFDIHGTPAKGDRCEVAALNFAPRLSTAESQRLKSYLIPGLDATLCRCPDCGDRASRGIWWYSPLVRDRVLRRITAFEALNRQPGAGDQARDGG